MVNYYSKTGGFWYKWKHTYLKSKSRYIEPLICDIELIIGKKRLMYDHYKRNCYFTKESEYDKTWREYYEGTKEWNRVYGYGGFFSRHSYPL